MRDLYLFKLTENPSLSPNKFFDLPFKGKLLVRTYFYKKWNNFGDKEKNLSIPQYNTVLKLSTCSQDLFDGVISYIKGESDDPKRNKAKKPRSLWTLQFLMENFSNQERIFGISKLNEGEVVDKVKKQMLEQKAKRRLMKFAEHFFANNQLALKKFLDNETIQKRLMIDYSVLLTKNYELSPDNGTTVLKKEDVLSLYESLKENMTLFSDNVLVLSQSQIDEKISNQTTQFVLEESNCFWSMVDKVTLEDGRELKRRYTCMKTNVLNQQFKPLSIDLVLCDPPYNSIQRPSLNKEDYNPNF